MSSKYSVRVFGKKIKWMPVVSPMCETHQTCDLALIEYYEINMIHAIEDIHHRILADIDDTPKEKRQTETHLGNLGVLIITRAEVLSNTTVGTIKLPLIKMLGGVVLPKIAYHTLTHYIETQGNEPGEPNHQLWLPYDGVHPEPQFRLEIGETFEPTVEEGWLAFVPRLIEQPPTQSKDEAATLMTQAETILDSIFNQNVSQVAYRHSTT